MNEETNGTTPPPLTDTDAPVVGGNIISRLLKSPQSVALAIKHDENLAREGAKMLGAALLCHAVFGFAVGFFSGYWEFVIMATWKAPLIALCAMLLCFPSLYIFTAVLGSPMKVAQTFAFACACLATTGLILVALAPVAWLFAVSTQSLPFVVMMVFLMWLVALAFTSKFLSRAKDVGLLKRQTGLWLWFFIFILVTLQMTTVMRPILDGYYTCWFPAMDDKMFFLKHFGECFESARGRYR